MKILYLDCVAGAAGDMLLSALCHLGVDSKLILDLPQRLGLENLNPAFESAATHGITGLRFTMPLPDHGPHRHLRHVKEIIEAGEISDEVKIKSIDAFTRLAEAEAKVHGSTPEQVHFHEVGADDAIIDIVGYFICLEALEWPDVYSLPPVLGHGVIKSAHGMIPLPGPAVTEILRGIPVTMSSYQGETVTPTGATLLATSASFDQCPDMIIEATGYGLGTRHYDDRPNLLRAVLGHVTSVATNDVITVIETNIDDMNPQIYGYLFDKLYDAGAAEVFITPVIMKKNRPGQLLTALCKKSVAPAVSNIIFAETTTAGVRLYESRRKILDRRETTVATPYGDVRVKILSLSHGTKIVPEFEDCRQCAEDKSVSVSTVMEAVHRLYAEKG